MSNNTPNPMINQPPDRADKLPVDFEKLPKPFLEQHSDWAELAAFAWQCASEHVRWSRDRWHMDAAWDPNRNYQWVWDTIFMTLYCRFSNGQLPGIQSLDNFYELQTEDGYIGMTYDMNEGLEPWPNRINPPLFAWAEWEYYRTTGDDSRIERVIPHIERLMAWIDANRRNEPHRRLTFHSEEDVQPEEALYQLYYFADGGSSGMDNSARTPRQAEAGKFFDWIDLSSQMALSFRMLSRLHAAVGHHQQAEHWEMRAQALGQLINEELWCEKTRFYHDRTVPQNFVAAKTAAGFWPILAGICPPERVAALVTHLCNPKSFNRPIPVPSLAADEVNYAPLGNYWNGGVWAPTNYMVTRGLQLAGIGDQAHRIAIKYLDGLVKTYNEYQPHTLWECYAPEAFQPGLAAYTGKPVKPDFVGWTGLGPIAMLIENILGFDLNKPESKLVWTIRLPEAHGIDNLGIGAGLLKARCAQRDNATAKAHIDLSANVDLDVEIHCGSRFKQVRLTAGKPVAICV